MNSIIQNIEEREVIKEMLDKPGWDQQRHARLEKIVQNTFLCEMNRMFLTAWNFGTGMTRSTENGRRNNQKNS